MKVGIVTVYDSNNFGSYLQAYALKKVIEKLGHNVYFIKFRTEKEAKKVFFPGKRKLLHYIKTYYFNNKKYNLFLKDRKIFDEISIKDVDKNSFDIIIIGSDECWNVKTETFRNKCFYGIDLPIKRKIAFSISCGKALSEDFAKFSELVDGIRNLEDIYVRDEQTRKDVKELIGKETEMVCDPTLMIDVKEFDKNYEINIKKDYLLIYSYKFSEKQIEYIKRFAREQNLLIVSVCFKHRFCDKSINCSPLQFCKIIQKSKYVVTTTFHGTIFSILNKKQFISIPSGQKVRDILAKLELEQCEFKEEKESYEIFKKKLLTKTDFNKTEKNILQWRNKSVEILKNILNEGN